MNHPSHLLRVIAFCLTFCLLGTACLPLRQELPSVARTTESFSALVYTRPDLEQILNKADEVADHSNRGLLPFRLFDALEDFSSLTETFYTQQTIAMIRNSVDVTDSYYRNEMTFLDQASSQLQTKYSQMYDQIFASRFGNLFKWMMGDSALEQRTLLSQTTSPEILSLQEEESRLFAAYTYEFSQATILFNGKEQQYSSLSVNDQEAARPIFLKKYNPIFGALFTQLVAVRTKIAHKLGFSDYSKVADLQMMRTGYDRADIRQFRQALKETLSPLYRSYQEDFYRRAAKASPSESVYLLHAPNPSPVGTWQTTLDSMEVLFSSMSRETETCFRYLRDHEFIDVAPSPNKAHATFTTTLYDMNTPFLFGNFNETNDDVLAFTHEFGHAFASFQQQEIGYGNGGQAMDICEIHSQAMQVLSLPQLGLFYGKEAKAARDYTVYTLLSSILTTAVDDEFQEIIYTNPTMTVPEINSTYQQLLFEYGLILESPYLDPSLISLQWFTVNQYFGAPFYAIDYALSGCVALSFLEPVHRDYDQAIALYFKLIEQPIADDFLTVLANTGLENPFDPAQLRYLAKVIADYLGPAASSQSKRQSIPLAKAA